MMCGKSILFFGKRGEITVLFRSIPEKPEILDHFQGGKGHLEAYPILNGVEEMQGKGRVFKHMVLQPGCEVGSHVHSGDCETVYVLKGSAHCKVNGEMMEIGPGMVHFIADGEEHYMINDGNEPLEFIALVLYT
jgi:mannose-6-phosphate isomerase-like protein (cupin superfamily)